MEVVIAIGVFATGIATILALVPSLIRLSAESADTQVALALPDAVILTLQREAATSGFDGLAARISPMTDPLPETIRLTASRNGDEVRLLASAESGVRGAYFLIETWRFAEGPLAYDSNAAGMALHVRVSWPFPMSRATDAAAPPGANGVTFPVCLPR